MAHYSKLVQIGEDYVTEVGTIGHRQEFLDGMASNYRAAVLRLQAAMAAVSTPVDYSQGSVKDRAARFQNHVATQAELKLRVDKAKALVHRTARKLTRMGARVVDDPSKPDFGHIDWGFSTQTVVYDTQLAQQGATRLRIHQGRLFTDDQHTLPFDTRLMVTANMGSGYAIYVMSATGNIHASSHSVGHRHHSSLLAGGQVAGAGEIQVRDGRLLWISNKSGHYFPEYQHFLQTLHRLEKLGIQLAAVKVNFLYRGSAPKGDSYVNAEALIAARRAEGNTYDVEYDKLLRYLTTMSYMEFAEAAAPKGWRWVNDAEIDAGANPADVVTLAGGRADYKAIRRWLKSEFARPVKTHRPMDALKPAVPKKSVHP